MQKLEKLQALFFRKTWIQGPIDPQQYFFKQSCSIIFTLKNQKISKSDSAENILKKGQIYKQITAKTDVGYFIGPSLCGYNHFLKNPGFVAGTKEKFWKNSLFEETMQTRESWAYANLG